MSKKVHLLPVLTDNYIFLIEDSVTSSCIVVDPAESEAVTKFTEEHDCKLVEIWLTHHHHDHIGGVDALRSRHKCVVRGLREAASRLPQLDLVVERDSTFSWCCSDVQVLFLPGHTRDHCAYYFKREGWLFSGDVLFSLGCGRLFEGTPNEMWESLKRIRALPDSTEIYCAHEYTEKNLAFVESLETIDEGLVAFRKTVNERRSRSEPTVPTELSVEKKLNPFLRADDPKLAVALKCEGKAEVDVFAELRRLRNVW